MMRERRRGRAKITQSSQRAQRSQRTAKRREKREEKPKTQVKNRTWGTRIEIVPRSLRYAPAGKRRRSGRDDNLCRAGKKARRRWREKRREEKRRETQDPGKKSNLGHPQRR